MESPVDRQTRERNSPLKASIVKVENLRLTVKVGVFTYGSNIDRFDSRTNTCAIKRH